MASLDDSAEVNKKSSRSNVSVEIERDVLLSFSLLIIYFLVERHSEFKEEVNMKKFIVLISILVVCFPAQSIFSQTAEEITARVIKAHGGEERLRSVRNLVITGKTESQDENAPDVKYRFTIVYPDKFRFVFNIQDTQAVFASNGTTSWNVNPMFGVNEPTEMTASEALEQKHQMDFLIPFLDKHKIQEIQNKGSFKEGQKEYFILKVEYKDGFLADYFIDKESFLIAKRRQIHRHDDGRESELIYTLSDYRDVKGIKLPFQFRSGLATLIYKIENYEINAGHIDDSLFEKPKK